MEAAKPRQPPIFAQPSAADKACGAPHLVKTRKLKDRWMVDFETADGLYTVAVDPSGNTDVTVWDEIRRAEAVPAWGLAAGLLPRSAGYPYRVPPGFLRASRCWQPCPQWRQPLDGWNGYKFGLSPNAARAVPGVSFGPYSARI